MRDNAGAAHLRVIRFIVCFPIASGLALFTIFVLCFPLYLVTPEGASLPKSVGNTVIYSLGAFIFARTIFIVAPSRKLLICASFCVPILFLLLVMGISVLSSPTLWIEAFADTSFNNATLIAISFGMFLCMLAELLYQTAKTRR